MHGGGGWRGCKEDVNDVSHDLVVDGHALFNHKYLVFSINYRLACHKSDLNLVGSPIRPYCGWPYPSDDSPNSPIDGQAHGPAIHDVQWVIEWVKANANGHCNCWNGTKIGLVGASWGGGIATMASYRLGTASPDQVQVIGSWSGGMEMQQQNNGFWPCDG